MTNKPKKHLTTRQVRERYGNPSEMTVYRWWHHPKMGFPKPIKIGKRNLFLESELEDYERRQVVANRCSGKSSAASLADLPSMLDDGKKTVKENRHG
jgi:predicted DNA-binding transcriptional regulator AlpA